MKTVFYLKDEIEFYNSDETECIIWVFRWMCNAEKQIAYSTDLRELIEKFYTEN